MPGSWSHGLARQLVRRLVGTRITPNHVTALRVLVGLGACVGFAWGDREGRLWGGVAWVLSALLDRADGELARISGRTSARGAYYDYLSDLWVNAAMFAAVGIGLRHSGLGAWAMPLGLVCGLSYALLLHWCEVLEARIDPGVVVLAGKWGFDPDDALYLIAPFAWTGVLDIMLVAAAIVLPPTAAVVGLWLRRSRRRLGQTRNV